MSEQGRLTLRVRGRFVLSDAQGRDVTPPRRKERGLLALLAMSPEKRRARSWIMDRLWSNRQPEQASGSLRRALSNLRRDLGDTPCIGSDRHDIWLTEDLKIDEGDALDSSAEVLEGLDVPDAEFEDWLRDIRQAARPAQTENAQAPVQIAGGTVVVVIPPEEPLGRDETFLVHYLLDSLSSRLTILGEVDIHVGAQPGPDKLARADTLLWLHLSSSVVDQNWHVRLRIQADRTRRFLWSGGTVLPMDLRAICEGTEVSAFVSTALAGLLGRSNITRGADKSAYLQLQRAAGRLFTGRREDLEKAESELARLTDHDGGVAALAWRAFACLTRVLEFREDPGPALLEARSYLEEARARDPDNPLVLSVAAGVEMKLGDDPELGVHYADLAHRANDQDPYALDAAAQAAKLRGDKVLARQLAYKGREMALRLPNAFYWDMEVCLTAIGTGELNEAITAAEAAHLKNPAYRPALRYICALAHILGDTTKAERAQKKLTRLEPGFELVHLSRPDYPMHTLRAAGHLTR